MTTAKAPMIKAMLLVAGVKTNPTRTGLVAVNVRVDVKLFHVQFPPSGFAICSSNTDSGFDGNV